MSTVLLLEKNEIAQHMWEKIFVKENFDVIVTTSEEETIRRARQQQPNLIFVGSQMEGEKGFLFLEQIRQIDPEMLIVVPTSPGYIEEELKTLEKSSYDFVNDPVKISDMMFAISDELELRAKKKEALSLPQQQATEYNFENIIAVSPQMKEILRMVVQVSKGDTTTVLLQGESGTGKEVIAQAIHYNSSRAHKPFVGLSCAAVPSTLLESELFGYERGAFTDAKSSKKGLFTVAEGGTIFLDEIGDMPLLMQTKLLRVLEERNFRKVGGTSDIDMDVRVIAATNKDLEAAVKLGHFREDLFHRINVFSIYLPPLRQRREDILPLFQHYLQYYNESYHKQIDGISFVAERTLREYSWPGNVRELRNVVERDVLVADGHLILPEHLHIKLPEQKKSPSEEISVQKNNGQWTLTISEKDLSLESVEKILVYEALKTTDWNQTQSAQKLKLSRFALRARMKKYDLFNDRESDISHTISVR